MAKTRTDYLTQGHDIAMKEYATPSGFTAICAGLPLKGDKLSWQQQATLDGYERAREYLSQPNHRGTNHALEFVLSDAPLESLNKLGGAMQDYSAVEARVGALQAEPMPLDGATTGRDLHRDRAAEIFGTPAGAVTEAQRRFAKSDNFHRLYGTPSGTVTNGDVRSFAKKGDLAGLRDWKVEFNYGVDFAAPGAVSLARVSYIANGKQVILTQDGNLLRDENGIARGAIDCEKGTAVLRSPAVLEHLRILREQITGTVDEKRLSRLTHKVAEISQRHGLPL